MKRQGYIYKDICEIKNVRSALISASKNKAKKFAVQNALKNFEENVNLVRKLLVNKSYIPNKYYPAVIKGGNKIMRLEKSICESKIMPKDLEVKHLGGSLYEISQNENVTSATKNIDGKIETFYTYDKTILTVRIKTRGEGVVAFIRLKYTQDDEFALVNKGISDLQNSDYLSYRSYVEKCKLQAATYFGAL